MKIAIVGTGNMGEALGRIWAQCGHQVAFSFSRDEQKLQKLAQELNASWGAVTNIVQEAELVLLAVHWSHIEDVLAKAGSLEGKIVLNCCVPLDQDNENLVLGTTTSGAEQLAAARPTARWVSAFNTSPSESLPVVFAKREEGKRPQHMLYGDDAGAKQIARQLILEVGFDPVDLGGLKNGRFVEPFAMVTAVLAYEHPGGEAFTYHFEKLQP